MLISIIDDDESVRLSLAGLIRSLGIGVRTFASAAGFLSSDALETTSCIVSDVDMPQLDGLGMQIELKRLGYATPIIFLSAFANESTRRTALDDGALFFLEKPISARDFEAALHAALNLS